MLVLITPTGARPDQFKLCAKWMLQQDYKGGVIWIIVDDGKAVTTNCVQPDFREGWQVVHIYPKPSWNGTNTQGRNIRAGVDNLLVNPDFNKVKAIFIIEDDDYYHSYYLTEMIKRFARFQLIGETNTIYYNVQWRQYCDNNNRQHSSLFQTAFTPKLIPLFLSCLKNKWIDADFWAKAQNKYLFHAGTLAIGIKGMPGRYGIGAGHRRSMSFKSDVNLNFLKQQIGNDAENYAGYYGHNSEPQHSLFVKSRR